MSTKKTKPTTTKATNTTTTTTTTTTSTSSPIEKPKVAPSKKKPSASKKSKTTKETEKQPIESICFYKELGVEKTATDVELKKAYYKKAREVHPDKNNSPEAKEEFQKLGRIYSILKEPSSRKFYDKHGDVEGTDLGGLKGEDLYNAWMEQYNIVRVSEERIKEFFKQQDMQKKSSGKQVSKDEEDDLIDFYNRQRGDMKNIKEYIIGCETKKDVERMCDHIKHLISKKRVKSYPIFFTSGVFSSKKPIDSVMVDQADEYPEEGEGDEIDDENEDEEDEDDESEQDENEEEEEEKPVKVLPKKRVITKRVVKTPLLKKSKKSTIIKKPEKKTVSKK
ncbi:hypothetical protein RB653_007941 [Dictyostelium firmibasis]|uniref:J domain-containing protein n=1 Tax=Dictyostelium firmibasis TaxID=79012 RepID=A0AAN7TMM6_9MYCE